MSKKFFISLFIIISLVFSYTFVFATDGALNNAAEDVRNAVGGAENAVEDAARDISGTSKNATGDLTENKDTTNNENDGKAGDNNQLVNTTDTTNTANNMDYTTRRTATDDTFMGMTSNAWTWVILAVAAVVIIALVWYYSTQITRDNYNNRNND